MDVGCIDTDGWNVSSEGIDVGCSADSEGKSHVARDEGCNVPIEGIDVGCIEDSDGGSQVAAEVG